MGKSKSGNRPNESKKQRLQRRIKKHKKKLQKMNKRLRRIQKRRKTILKIRKPKEPKFKPQLLKNNDQIYNIANKTNTRAVALAYRVYIHTVEYDGGEWKEINDWGTHHINVSMPSTMNIPDFVSKYNKQLKKIIVI